VSDATVDDRASTAREVIVLVDQQVTQLVDRQRTVLVGKVAP